MVKQKHSINFNPNKVRTETHKQKILEFLLTGCSLTPWQAITFWKCTKLATRISELRDEEWEIQQEWTESDEGVRAMKYWM